MSRTHNAVVRFYGVTVFSFLFLFLASTYWKGHEQGLYAMLAEAVGIGVGSALVEFFKKG